MKVKKKRGDSIKLRPDTYSINALARVESAICGERRGEELHRLRVDRVRTDAKESAYTKQSKLVEMCSTNIDMFACRRRLKSLLCPLGRLFCTVRAERCTH